MLIYVEKRVASHPRTQHILAKFPKADVLFIEHYKNIFDKNVHNAPLAQAIILAELTNPSIIPAPRDYWYNRHSFFFRTSLNCFFDCDYCYLKWAFKSRFPVIFVNYEDVAASIKMKIEEIRNSSESNSQEDICFYASNYADLQAIDHLTQFNNFFIPLFEQFENVILESRTKSINIQDLLKYKTAPQNFEIAFSINPEVICQKYEVASPPVEQRIAAAQQLIEKWFKVGIRFLPLMPVPNFLEIYQDFLDTLCEKLDFEKVHSVFIWSLLYTKSDYKAMFKHYPDADFLSRLEESDDGLLRVKKAEKEQLYAIFQERFKKNFVQFG